MRFYVPKIKAPYIYSFEVVSTPSKTSLITKRNISLKSVFTVSEKIYNFLRKTIE